MKFLRITGGLFALCGLLALASCGGSPAFYADDLRCEDLVAPLGIDSTTPRLSWKLKGKNLTGVQVGYEIEAASSPELLLSGQPDLWASGKVDSGASVSVPYGGIPLKSRSLCYWRVRVWGSDGQESPWSEITRFAVGALDGLCGEYVGASPLGGDITAPLMRKKVNIDTLSTSFLHVNSLGYHEVYINGVKVGEDVLSPAVSQLSQRSLIVTYDVSEYLHEGENDLVIWLGQGWYKRRTFKAVYEGPLVKAELDVLSSEGWETIVSTDETWMSRESGYTDLGMWGAWGFGGEKIDGRTVIRDLSSPALDGLEWAPVVAVEVSDMTATPQMCEGNRIMRVLRAVSVQQLDSTTYLVDMGKVQTGWLEMRMPILPSGHEVRMEYGDALTAEGEFESQRESDVYVCAGQEGEYFINKFNHHAFRYIRISNLLEAPDPESIKSLQISGGYSASATFECSDKDLNDLYAMLNHTLRCLTFSGYMVDCPHIERMGYGGDGNSSTMTLQTMYDVAPLYKNWLQAWGDVMKDDGSLPHVAPNPGKDGGGPYWCAFIVLAPWRTYMNYDDIGFIEKYFDKMKKWFEYVDKYTVDGLLKRWPDTEYRCWYLGDWLPPMGVDPTDQSSIDLVNNCCISDCLGVMSKIAKLLGKPEEAASYDERKAALNDLLHRTYYNALEGTYATGSQIDMCYPMLVGVVPDSLYAKVEEKLLCLTHTQYNDHLAVGLVGVPILTQWAIENRQPDFFYKMLKQRDYPGYLYMIDNGATATWESWNGNRSRVHNCYNGFGLWFFQALGGIRADEPGYKHVCIDPQIPQGVTWTKLTKETPYGTLAVEWELKGSCLDITVVVPCGVNATICIPDKAIGCSVNGKDASIDRPIDVKTGIHRFKFELGTNNPEQ